MGDPKRPCYSNEILSKAGEKLFGNTIDLSTPQKIIEKRNELKSKLPEIKMRYGNTPDNNLYYELLLGPSYFEGVPYDPYDDSSRKLELNDRLDFFKDRLVEQHKNYKEIIELYCALYKKLKNNPLIDRTFSEQILSTLNDKKDD